MWTFEVVWNVILVKIKYQVIVEMLKKRRVKSWRINAMSLCGCWTHTYWLETFNCSLVRRFINICDFFCNNYSRIDYTEVFCSGSPRHLCNTFINQSIHFSVAINWVFTPAWLSIRVLLYFETNGFLWKFRNYLYAIFSAAFIIEYFK